MQRPAVNDKRRQYFLITAVHTTPNRTTHVNKSILKKGKARDAGKTFTACTAVLIVRSRKKQPRGPVGEKTLKVISQPSSTLNSVQSNPDEMNGIIRYSSF